MATTTTHDQTAVTYRRAAISAATQQRFWFLAIALLIVSEAIRPMTADSDFYAHAAVGRWIVEHHAIPQSTLFLWSAHESWIAHSWLAETAIFGIARVGDSAGISIALVLEAIILIAVFAIPFFARRQTGSKLLLVVAATGLCVFAGSSRFQVRPELFSDLALVVLVKALIRLRRDISALENAQFLQRRLLPIIALFALWANLHGGVIWGLGLLVLQFAGETLQTPQSADVKRWAQLAVAAWIGTIFTPFGIRYYGIFFPANPAVFASIEEWTPALQYPFMSIPALAAAAVVTLLAISAWLRNPERRWAHALWLVLGVFAVLLARRNILVASIISLIVFLEYVESIDSQPEMLPADAEWDPADTTRVRTARLVTLAAAGTVAALLAYGVVRSPLAAYAAASQSARPDAVPAGQVDFLKSRRITGRIFNDYNNASYLEWKLADRNTFFIDGLNAYPDAILAASQTVFAGSDEGLAYLDRNGVNCVVGRRRDPRFERRYPPLYHTLTHDPRWALVYAGADGPIWVRRIPQYESLWKKALR